MACDRPWSGCAEAVEHHGQVHAPVDPQLGAGCDGRAQAMEHHEHYIRRDIVARPAGPLRAGEEIHGRCIYLLPACYPGLAHAVRYHDLAEGTILGSEHPELP